MGWKKWALAILLMPFTGGLSLIFLIGFEYIKLAIKLDIYVLYLIIRIPTYIFIQYPLHVVFAVGDTIESGLHHAFGRIHDRPKIYGPVLLISTYVSYVLLPYAIFQFSSPPEMGVSLGAMISGLFWILSVLKGLILNFGVGLLITMMVSGLANKAKPRDVARKDLPGNAKAAGLGAAGAAMGGAALGMEAGEQALEGYDMIQQGGGVEEVAKEAIGERLMPSVPGDMEAIGMDIIEGFPLIGGGAAAEGAVAAEGAAAEGAAVAGAEGAAAAGAGAAAAPAIAVIIGAILLALLGLAVQLVLFLGAFLAIGNLVLPYIAKPLMGAIGVGEAYGGWATDRASNQYTAGMNFDDERDAVAETVKKIECAMKGPECLQQWRLNNTKRPGSTAQGETYGLKIDNFRVGSGSALDVAFKEEDYALPLSFQIANNRHGLKGINARDIKYKLVMYDGEHGLDTPYCSTGWVKPEAYDVDGDEDKNDLYPGTSAATGFLRLTEDYGDGEQIEEDEEFTLENCNMLQPGPSSYRKVRLYVSYDYFSQATLYFEAMSRQAQSSQNIKIERKDSVTADTPVKAALGVEAPALFDEEEVSDRDYAGQPIPVTSTLNTDDRQVSYQVQDFKIRKSSQTCIMNGNGECIPDSDTGINCDEVPNPNRYAECSGTGVVTGQDTGSSSGALQNAMECSLERDLTQGPNFFELDDRSKKRLIAGEGGEGNGLPEDYWFDDQNPPDIFGCIMGLKDPASINPGGETLTMGIAANYTVRIEKDIESFELINSRCSSLNCPFVFPLKKDDGLNTGVIIADKDYLSDDNESNDDYYWKKMSALCGGSYGYNGCSVAEEYDPYDMDKIAEINQGELAVEFTRELINSKFDRDHNMFTCYVRKVNSNSSDARQFTKKVVGNYWYDGADEEDYIIGKTTGISADDMEEVMFSNKAFNYTPTFSSNWMNGWQVTGINRDEEYDDCNIG